MYIQVMLTKEESQMVAWVEKDKRLKEGVKLTLKDVEGKWTVEKLYTRELETPYVRNAIKELL